MKIRLGYPDRIVEVKDRTVYVFKGRLVSAPLNELVSYYLKGDGLLPPAIREVARDVVDVLLRTGELEMDYQTGTQYIHGLSG
ncbi:hypothetical protein [Thermococcus sp. MV11]|uniref:hypothetical protein n=1 Tax=Thermococcus sp. MV11 TaxID=1638267 RepID=UPI0014311823|nr:hypothetical protein [Thermococcus sp. MV11]NJE02639.1 hypothetical protein [Thermococcus sp. MV11]